MQLCFYLLLVLHVAEGCTLENHGKTKEITAYTGESVLLPCYCTDTSSKPERFTWKTLNTWEVISNKSVQYRDRVQLFNSHSPGNFSLLISHLTEEDGGVYKCEVEGNGHTFIRLTVKGCSLEESSQTPRITAYKGGSVLLPCYCTELRAKPERITWTKYKRNGKVWEEVSNKSGQYRDRVQLFNSHSPGNLSLLISHLTEEDGGRYWCEAEGSGHRVISLTVEGIPPPTPSSTLDQIIPTSAAEPSSTVSSQKESPPSLPFVPFALVTVVFLHIVVAVVYCTKRSKGCSLEATGQTTYITAFKGGSVLLPCYCTELRAKPERITWKFVKSSWTVIPIKNIEYQGRFQLHNSQSPGNLSLLISHLTEEDGGGYWCDTEGSGHTDIELTIEESPPSLPFVPFALVTVVFLHIVVAVVYCTKRSKGCQGHSQLKQLNQWLSQKHANWLRAAAALPKLLERKLHSLKPGDWG
ncbi:junctional adhesion molecule-like [Hoplias malabaricus]|uniref:junctional adhesion molecule-like n=1 Tax=Hoplias malabaricus TaxID=27720 RepID=UPI003462DB63